MARPGARLTVLNRILVAGSVVAVYLIATRPLFRRHTEQDVLSLPKLNREFE